MARRPCPCGFLILAFSAKFLSCDKNFAFSAKIWSLAKFFALSEKKCQAINFLLFLPKFGDETNIFTFPAKNWSWDKYFHISCKNLVIRQIVSLSLPKIGHATNKFASGVSE